MTRASTEGVEAVLRERLATLSLEAKTRLLTGADFWSLHPEPAVGLRRMVLSDGPAGVRGELWDERDPSANVPSPTALAASWDEARVERLGRLLAAEARRKGVDVLLAPTVNLHRSPYGGRHFECFSEDPLLTARIGVAYVRGLQAGGVAATVKHFVANDSETDRFTVDVRVGERALRERYLAPFEPIVREAGVWAVMAAYSSVNGTTATEHPMLGEVLKDQWGFDGGRHVGLVRGPLHRAGRQRRARPGHARPRRPLGRPVDRRGPARPPGSCCSATPRSTGPRCSPWSVRRCDGWPCSAPTPRSPGPSVAAAPPSSRPTPSPPSTACGPPSAPPRRSTTSAAPAAPTGSRWPRWPCFASRTAAARGWRCGSWPPTAPSADESSAPAPRSPG